MLKFSRSPYFDNHLSCLHHRYLVRSAYIPQDWTPGSVRGGGARGQNLVHIQKIGVLRLSFLDVHILTTTCHTYTIDTL